MKFEPSVQKITKCIFLQWRKWPISVKYCTKNDQNLAGGHRTINQCNTDLDKVNMALFLSWSECGELCFWNDGPSINIKYCALVWFNVHRVCLMTTSYIGYTLLTKGHAALNKSTKICLHQQINSVQDVATNEIFWFSYQLSL